jgi:hypothetical protein
LSAFGVVARASCCCDGRNFAGLNRVSVEHVVSLAVVVCGSMAFCCDEFSPA